MMQALAIAGIFLGFVALLPLSIRWFANVMGRVAGSGVRYCHEKAEQIITTGEVPEDWRASERWGNCTNIDECMNRLITHFERSPLVADESTRQLLLLELRGAQHRWKESGTS